MPQKVSRAPESLGFKEFRFHGVGNRESERKSWRGMPLVGELPGWGSFCTLRPSHFPIEISPKSIQTFAMNLPNSLTLSRIFAVPLLVVILLTRVNSPDREVVGFSIYAATLIFLGASITDYLDGYLARKRQQVTTLGMLLDPVADKLLTSAAFISLVGLKWVPAWMVVIIIGRDIAVSGLRNIASSEGFTIDASELGKIKMAMQVVAITLIILCNKFYWLRPFSRLALWLGVIFALVSAIDYFRKFLKKVDDRVQARQRRELIT